MGVVCCRKENCDHVADPGRNINQRETKKKKKNASKEEVQEQLIEREGCHLIETIR